MLERQRATLLWKGAGLTGEQLVLRAIPPSTLSRCTQRPVFGLLRRRNDRQ
jgi:hypothetical protein